MPSPTRTIPFTSDISATPLLGEVLARLVEFAGFDTIRATYPGDIGLGVITVVWMYQKFYRGQEPQGIHERGQWLLKLYVEATSLLEPKENETPEAEGAARSLRSRTPRTLPPLGRRRPGGPPALAGDARVEPGWSCAISWSMLDIHIDVWFFESEVDEPSKQIVEELIRLGIADDERPDGAGDRQD